MKINRKIGGLVIGIGLIAVTGLTIQRFKTVEVDLGAFHFGLWTSDKPHPLDVIVAKRLSAEVAKHPLANRFILKYFITVEPDGSALGELRYNRLMQRLTERQTELQYSRYSYRNNFRQVTDAQIHAVAEKSETLSTLNQYGAIRVTERDEYGIHL